MMANLSQFLKDGTQNYSSTRFVLLAWYGVVGLIWSVVSLRAGALAVIPESVLILLGVVTAQKLGQNVTEMKNGGK
jgi:hypothetical protein